MMNLKEMSKSKLYFKLFTSTFALSAFTFGGGYVIVPLMKQKYVDELGWLEEKEMLNFAAIAQSSPGAVAVNAAMLVGFRVAGVVGALIATVGTVLPPLIIIGVISMFYDAFRTNKIVSAVLGGIQAGVAAVITAVVVDMAKVYFNKKDIPSIILMVIAFIATYFFGVNVILIILASGVFGAFRIFYKNK